MIKVMDMAFQHIFQNAARTSNVLDVAFIKHFFISQLWDLKQSSFVSNAFVLQSKGPIHHCTDSFVNSRGSNISLSNCILEFSIPVNILSPVRSPVLCRMTDECRYRQNAKTAK